MAHAPGRLASRRCNRLLGGALAPISLALRRGDPAAVPALRRFSATIPYVVIALVAAGVVLAVMQAQELDALATTTYGRVLLVKLGLIAALFLLAAVNRWRLTPSRSSPARPLPRRGWFARSPPRR